MRRFKPEDMTERDVFKIFKFLGCIMYIIIIWLTSQLLLIKHQDNKNDMTD